MDLNNDGFIVVERNPGKNNIDHGKKPLKSNAAGLYKVKTPRARPDTLIIKTKEGRSYKDVLKSLRYSTRAAELGDNIKNVKRAKSGDVLITVGNRSNLSTNALITELGKTLGDETSIRQLGNNKLLQIKYLDEVTTEDEVKTAVHEALGPDRAMDKIIVRNFHAWPDGTQSANVLVSEREAATLLKKGKIKVGWLMCPVTAKQ